MDLTDQHTHEVGWGNAPIRLKKVQLFLGMMAKKDSEKQNSTYMQIISLCREEGLRVSLSRKKRKTSSSLVDEVFIIHKMIFFQNSLLYIERYKEKRSK